MNDDHSKYYNLESYLFGEVSKRYAKTKTVSTPDFFCIVIWKANRAKSKVAGRLLAKKPYKDLESAIGALVKEVSEETDMKGQLSILINGWGFRLPMASAILTVLFPDKFTIYDFRVCEVLNDFQRAEHLTFEPLWKQYSGYIKQVSKIGQGLSLRDKDRWLWGKSFISQLIKDIKNQFGRTADEDDSDE